MQKYLILAILGLNLSVLPALAEVTSTSAFSATGAEAVSSNQSFWDEPSSTSTPIISTTPMVQPRTLISEPIIRVGVSKDKTFTFHSDVAYVIYSGGIGRAVIPAGVTSTISYAAGRYTVVGEAVNFGTGDFLRLVPSDPTSVFSLDDYERRFEKGKVNYNQYRGTLEFRYSPKSKEAYVINELPLEEYLAGIAEVGKDDPIEYVSALIVAARSYAYSQMGAPVSDKHLFDVYGSTVDQLYLGYVSELNHPNVAAAAEATRGQMVTYQSKPVMTQYFGRSNGKTLTWDRPGRAKRPWLKSVVAKYDKGKRFSGHGYGISMADARLRALKDSWVYDQIIKYYYTGVEVEKIY